MSVSEQLVSEVESAVDDLVASRSGLEGENQTQAEGAAGEVNDRDVQDEEGTGDETGDNPEVGEDGGEVDSEGAGGGEDRQEGERGSGEGDGGRDEVVAPSVPSETALIDALRVGIPISDARTFASDESLYRAIEAVKIAAAESAGNENGGEESPEQDPLADFPELDPEKYDENVIKAFEATKALIRAQNETINELRSSHEQSVVAGRQSAARDVEQWFDRQVEALGEDFAESLGKGAYSALDRGSSQFAKRDQIASKMSIILAGYQSTGQSPPPREEVFSEAARLVLHDDFVAARERKLAKDLENRAGQHIARPGGKNTKQTKSPLEETAELIDRKYFGR